MGRTDRRQHRLTGSGDRVREHLPGGATSKDHSGATSDCQTQSKHDGKDAALIAFFHLVRGAKPAEPHSPQRRDIRALLDEVNELRLDKERLVNHLEAHLGRWWPTVPLPVSKLSLLHLLACFGDPEQIAINPDQAADVLRKHSRGKLNEAQIQAVLQSAQARAGVPMTEVEQGRLKALAQRLLEAHRQFKSATARLEAHSASEPAVASMSFVGKVTAAVLVALLGQPSLYSSAKQYEKAAGLNFRERSSGKAGRPRGLTKRGPSLVRRYIYLAALRLVQNEPIVRAWYNKKVARDGNKVKLKAVVAVMRKLIQAMWHVGQGKVFDASKLFNASGLSLEQG